MLKKIIPFKDFEGKDRTEVAYFHITRTELTDLVANDVLDPEEMMSVGAMSDGKQMFKMLKKIVDLSYGIRAEDGVSFVKDEATLKRFKQSLAYDALIMDMLSGEGDSFLDFVKGVFPKDLMEEAMKSLDEQNGEPTNSTVIPMPTGTVSPEPVYTTKPSVDTEDPVFKEAVARAVEERMRNAVSGSTV